MADAESLQLDTIKNLRNFFSKEVLEALCYYSEAQQCLGSIVKGMNTAVTLFKKENPAFSGQFHVAGHGIGGCLLSDIMAGQGQEAPPPAAVPVATAPAPAPGPMDYGDDEDDATGEAAAEEAAAAAAASIVPEKTWQDLLKELGLDEFIEALEKDDVDLETLTDCTDSDFKEFGFSLGQRKKAIKAIKTLGETTQKAAEEAAKVQEEDRVNRAARRAERRLEKRRLAAEAAEQNAAATVAALQSSMDEQTSRARQLTAPDLEFTPENCFFFGAPIGLFASLQPRDQRSITPTTSFKTCTRVFNVFHPYDPMAYRLEPLVAPEVLKMKTPPELVPHHAGSKRMHLEFKDYVKATSTDLKKEVSGWASSAWSAFKANVGGDDNASRAVMSPEPPAGLDALPAGPPAPVTMGALNSGNRIDWKLQEDALEIINENLRSMKAHSSYWTSHDAAFFIINRIYKLD